MKNKLFLSILGMIGIVALFGIFLYFIGHRHNENCYWKMPSKYKICIDERYNEYMIKDLDSSRIYGDGYFVNMNHNTTVTLSPYIPYNPDDGRFIALESLFPTMFDDSCTAKAYLKFYINKKK